MSEFRPVGGFVNRTKYKMRPRYSMVFHDVREKLGLSLNTYVVIDSIHKLSSSDHRYPYCIMSKTDLASFLKLGERTVYRSLNEAEQAGLIERTDHGLRPTEKWINSVEIYDIKAK
jgi:DNA-binding MarR family transcriptional regulator